MAITKTEVQVLWAAAANLSVGASSTGTSDAFSPDATAVNLSIQCKADNDGTAAAGDVVDFYLRRTLGDPDGASTAEYETDVSSLFLCRLDTSVTDPREKIVDGIGANFLSGTIYAVNGSAARAQTVSATIYEMRVA